jgi:hypothetical protein
MRNTAAKTAEKALRNTRSARRGARCQQGKTWADATLRSALDWEWWLPVSGWRHAGAGC